MKKLLSKTLVVCVAIAMISSTLSLGDDAKPSQAGKSVKAKSKNRLPNQYGKLGLSDEQKAKVYKIQAGYRTQIEKLQQQIAELRKQQNSETRAVLTEGQQASLKTYRATARKIRDARKKARAEAESN